MDQLWSQAHSMFFGHNAYLVFVYFFFSFSSRHMTSMGVWVCFFYSISFFCVSSLFLTTWLLYMMSIKQKSLYAYRSIQIVNNFWILSMHTAFVVPLNLYIFDFLLLCTACYTRFGTFYPASIRYSREYDFPPQFLLRFVLLRNVHECGQ